MSVLTQPVLVLNRSWQPINDRYIVEKALTDMTREKGKKWGKPSKIGVYVELIPNEEGSFDLGSGTRPVEWDEWITLPVRTDHHDDRSVHTHIYTWAAPCVVICTGYEKMNLRTRQFTPAGVHERDDYVCGYSGEKLTRETASVDHIHPRSRGGKNQWDNVTSCHKRINTLKGAKTPEEAGLVLMRKPRAPKPVPASATIREAKHVQWIPFLIK